MDSLIYGIILMKDAGLSFSQPTSVQKEVGYITRQGPCFL